MENNASILITVTSSVNVKMLEIYDGKPATLTVVLNPDLDVALTASSQTDISFSPVATDIMALGTTPTGWIKGTDAGGVTLTCSSTKKWTKGEALSFTITNVNYSVGQSPVALAPVNNSLFLSLTNIDAKALFSGSASKGSPQVKIWFVYGTDSGCLAPPTKFIYILTCTPYNLL